MYRQQTILIALIYNIIHSFTYLYFMNAAELKYNIFQLISSINDQKELKSIYNSLVQKSNDWSDDLTSEQLQSIYDGLDDFKNNRVIANTDALTQLSQHMKRYE